ncbi:putative C6 zinc finger protein [Rosellinia necatrix]|uniref:Putative C6 zinc finger protein n=1 Tax=Rosellinia necatrix TaxID=77044 RepID=A0A1W2TV03_ROSNE|nr:putative C6 zinc finger protein [Rosellinia necatrix]
MRALLAISSLQLAYYRPHMRDHYQSAAMHHHQTASRVATDLMQDVSPSTAENLFLFSVLTIFYAFGCPRHDSHLLLVGEGGIPSWLLLHQGTRALTELASSRADGPLAPVFAHGADRWRAREVRRQAASSAHQHLDRLQALIERSEPDEGLRGAYVKAIAELRKSFLTMDCEVGRAYDVTDLFVWVFEVAGDFLPLLRAPTQNAVTILAFFCVLLKGLKSQWWLHGWADHLIARSYALLDREHRLLIQWPMEEIGYVP